MSERTPETPKTPLQAAMEDVQAKTEEVAFAKRNIGTVRAAADRERKAKIQAAREKLTDAKVALEQARKVFDREVRAAGKP